MGANLTEARGQDIYVPIGRYYCEPNADAVFLSYMPKTANSDADIPEIESPD